MFIVQALGVFYQSNYKFIAIIFFNGGTFHRSNNSFLPQVHVSRSCNGSNSTSLQYCSSVYCRKSFIVQAAGLQAQATETKQTFLGLFIRVKTSGNREKEMNQK
jgi:hypothetical protein